MRKKVKGDEKSDGQNRAGGRSKRMKQHEERQPNGRILKGDINKVMVAPIVAKVPNIFDF